MNDVFGFIPNRLTIQTTSDFTTIWAAMKSGTPDRLKAIPAHGVSFVADRDLLSNVVDAGLF
jgi:hypothetical protein